MRRLAIAVAIAAVGIAGCGDDSDNPNGPSNTTIFTVQLASTNEVPPVSNAEAGSLGTAVITIHRDTNVIDFAVSMNSFPTGAVLRAAHIHGPNGPAGVNQPVLVDTGLTPGTAITIGSDGRGTFTFTGVPASADNISQITANPQNFYFNVHSNANTGGVIRGQLR